MTYNDNVNHPLHYAKGWSNGAEVIDITEHLNFCRGNAVKYIARAGKKDSTTLLEDLEKAQWYLNREIERVRSEWAPEEAVTPFRDQMWDWDRAEPVELADWEREILGLATNPQMPRVFQSIWDVPEDTDVADADGDLWHWHDDDLYVSVLGSPWNIWESDPSDQLDEDVAPFTEVLP